MTGTSLVPRFSHAPALQKNFRLTSCPLYGHRRPWMAVCLQPPHTGESIESKRSLSMKSAISKPFAQAAYALLAGTLVLAAGITASAQQSTDGLKGTWRLAVTQYNCANP